MFQSFETGFGPFDPAAMSLFIALAVAAVFLVTAIRVLPQSRATAIAGIAAAAAILGWHALMERVSAANLIAATPDQIVPPTPFAIALPVLIALGFIFRSQNLRAFVAALPLPAVTAVQAYRMLGYT
ncbi:MAG: hypothetical protein ABL907_17030, partial [Hyphomicrobium sp.]